ncbi:jg3855 [Pararge aegeria aegeria]|uniref:Jg3855 protein n=1 Tax=Pararge aegeria aegeria TaxID=348720 RepID=A0A8S4S3X2_9NEOP|nr:jg3855 [Pararge aegeria aegeria]
MKKFVQQGRERTSGHGPAPRLKDYRTTGGTLGRSVARSPPRRRRAPRGRLRYKSKDNNTSGRTRQFRIQRLQVRWERRASARRAPFAPAPAHTRSRVAADRG